MRSIVIWFSAGFLIGALLCTVFLWPSPPSPAPQFTDTEKAKQLIAYQNYCMELGDCTGLTTILEDAGNDNYSCKFLNTSEYVIEDKIQTVKAACNMFSRLNLFKPKGEH